MSRAQPLTLDDIRPDFEKLLVGPLALAVSGGADSMALMHLVAAWVAEPETAQRQGMGPVPLVVLTVDHRLRPGSAEEAAWVGSEAVRLGLPHATLVWDVAKPTTAIQSTAREARYRLMDGYLDHELRERRVAAKRRIVVAHHEDDQAETVLMRLARGSGLDGMSGMREEERVSTSPSVESSGGSFTIVRPLLRTPKARLIATLETAGRSWRDDPSNVAPEFERVRVRQALETLGQLGIGPAQIGRSAWRLSRARRAVLTGVGAVATSAVNLHGGLFAEIDPECLAELPEEYAVRILAGLLRAFGGAGPPARLSQIEQLAARVMPSGGICPGVRSETLGGCRIERDGAAGPVRIWREWGREGLPVLDLQPGSGKVWDQRFWVALATGASEPAEVRALGPEKMDGWGGPGNLPGLHGVRAPPDAIRTLPSFRQSGRLVAVPYFGDVASFSAQFVPNHGW